MHQNKQRKITLPQTGIKQTTEMWKLLFEMLFRQIDRLVSKHLSIITNEVVSRGVNLIFMVFFGNHCADLLVVMTQSFDTFPIKSKVTGIKLLVFRTHFEPLLPTSLVGDKDFQVVS